MNTLIIYDSAFGNTKQIADTIAETLRKYSSVQVLSVAEADIIELTGLDFLIVGSPTRKHTLTNEMRTLLEGMLGGSLQGLAAATFDTRYRMSEWLSGSAAYGIAKKLQRAGAKLIVPPESFFVHSVGGPLEDGERERAVDWAEKAIKQLVSA